MVGPASTSPSPREHLAAFASLTPRVARAAWVGGIALAVGLAATAIWALSTKRLYRSESVLLYERGVQSASMGAAPEGDSARQVGLRLKDMLTARPRLESAIKEMKLYPALVEQRSVVDAIDEMRTHISLGVGDGYAYRASYDAESRELAQKVLDRLVKTVVDDDGRRRMKEAEDAKRFLDTERKHADEDLRTKEGALGAFLALHPQLAAETGASAANAGGMIRAADRDRAPANQGEVAALEMQAAQLEDALVAAGQKPSAGPGEPLIDPNVAAARVRAQAEVQAAQRDLADKEARFTNEHPDVKAALRRVAAAEATLRRAEAAVAAPRPMAPPAMAPAVEEGSGRAAALRRALSAVRAQIASVRSRATPRAEVPREAHSMVAIDTEWTRLTRETAEARERQSLLEGKQFQAQLMATLVGGGQAGRLVVADPPFKPTRPIAGGRFKIALVGGVASMLLGLLSVLAMAAFDDRLYAARDVERIMGNSIVVTIPRLMTTATTTGTRKNG
jgi:hypothetical protein